MTIEYSSHRRQFLLGGGGAASGLLLGAMTAGRVLAAEEKEKEVGAVEDLMREHGILRRALLVYHSCATRLRTASSALPTEPIRKTAELFRSFGEDYHERKLEEAHIFPVVRRTKGPAAAYPDVLVAQHERGREITDYILSVASADRIATANVEPLGQALDAFVLMYQHHTAREDTIVFTAWKAALSEKTLDEMGEKFEAIEHASFGKDGFEDAVATIGRIEQALGLADIAQFTAPTPPRAEH